MDGEYFIEKICIPKEHKKDILWELNTIYSITSSSIYLRDGYLEKNYGQAFNKLKEEARLKTLYTTDADKLSKSEEAKAKSYFKIDCRNMIKDCPSLSKIL